MAYYLSIDYGGTNTKAIIFDEEGKQISVSSFQTLRIEEKPGFREVNLIETWQAISQSIRRVLDKAHLKGEDIACVACIGHGKGLYLLDKKGQEFTNGILSTDERAAETAQIFEARLDAIWEKTRQHVVAVQSPVLLHWLKYHQLELYQQIGSILSAKDYVRFKLTGQINQEYGDASGNHWINFASGTYDDAILDFFDIAEMKSALPPLVDYKEIVGGVSPTAAVQTGLAVGTPVIGGLFDIDACAIGSGVLRSDMFSVIAGTWNINTYPSKTAASKTSGQMNSYFPNRDFLIEESSPTSAGNLDLILKMLMRQEMDSLQEQGESIYDTLETFLETTDASFSQLIFFPFLYGSNVNPYAEASFIGLTSRTTRSEMLRAVYEGIVFAHKQHIDKLIATHGQKPQVIRLSGGGSNSKQWCQMFADILAIPVEVLESNELGGLGGAIASLQAMQGLSLESAVEKMVTVKQGFTPNAQEHDRYLLKYKVYQALLQQLDPVWQELQQLKNS